MVVNPESASGGAHRQSLLEPVEDVEPVRRTRVLAKALRTRSGAFGAVLTSLCLGIALLGPFFARHSPLDFVSFPFDVSTAQFPLGTDALGRDALSRVLHGGQTILLLAAAASVLGVAVGALIGVAAAYLRGLTDEVIMRAMDILLAFPQTILALLFLSVLGTNLWIVALIVAIIHAPQVARVSRAAALRVIEEDYVAYAELIGMSWIRVILREVVPNIMAPLLVELGLRFTYSVAIIAGLNFLGFGVQPPFADWGLMVNENRIGLETNPWPVAVPVILIAVLTIGVNILTDAVSRAASR